MGMALTIFSSWPRPSPSLDQDLSPSSIDIIFRAPFNATTFAVESIDPPGEGPLAGGTRVRIRGRGFDARATVLFGGVEARDVRILHSALIEALTPEYSVEGVVDIEVRQGNDRASLTRAFRYRVRKLRNLLLEPEALGEAGVRSVDIAGLGLRVAAADLNADGRSDLVLSSPLEERAPVRIIFGRDSWPAMLDEANVTIKDEPAVADLAWHFDVGTDVDGDGFGDLVLGGRDRDASPFEAPGRTYLVRGRGADWPREIEMSEAVELVKRCHSQAGPAPRQPAQVSAPSRGRDTSRN